MTGRRNQQSSGGGHRCGQQIPTSILLRVPSGGPPETPQRLRHTNGRLKRNEEEYGSFITRSTDTKSIAAFDSKQVAETSTAAETTAKTDSAVPSATVVLDGITNFYKKLTAKLVPKVAERAQTT